MLLVQAIEVKNLVKKFGNLTAVDSVSIGVSQGEIFGLLGPNGAGKTTLISMLVTMKKPTSGSAEVNGFDVVKQSDKVRASIGIVFQDPSLDEELTAYENLELHASMYGIPNSGLKAKIEQVSKIVELNDRLNDLVKTFSGGMKRRLEIARGLLHQPKILFLDEPTIGLDPQTRKHIWEYIKKLKTDYKMTLLLTTHYLDEADMLCDRVAIIDHGKIVALDTPTKLKNSLGGDVIVIKTENQEKFASLLSKLPWIKDVKIHDGAINIRLENADQKIVDLTTIASKNGIILSSITFHKPTLDDVFMHYTGKTIREESGSAKDHMRQIRKAWVGRK